MFESKKETVLFQVDRDRVSLDPVLAEKPGEIRLF